MERLTKNSPCFESICLPGMTEEYKMSLFVHIELETKLKLVYVCAEESSANFLQELEGFAINVFQDLHFAKINDSILNMEQKMFEKLSNFSILDFLDMREVLNTIISNTTLEQFTCYNFPLNSYD